MNKKKFMAWILFFSWLLVIFLFSNQNGFDSGHLSSGIVDILAKIIPLSATVLSFIIRKFAHFTEYLILGILTINLLKQYKFNHKKLVIYTLIFCFLYAGSDEFHQSFITDRSPQLIDVFIDTMGSAFGIGGFILIKREKRKRNA